MTSTSDHACFGMYPFEPIRPAWEALIAAVHGLAPWVPPTLDWDEVVQDSWRDRTCVLGQACGWPVATTLVDEVRVAGAFSLRSAGADGHRYRSVLVAREAATPAALAASDSRAAANSNDSLSGWVSLLAGCEVGAGWPGDVLWTGAHVESLRAVREGRADIASIDGHSLALVRRADPSVMAGVVEIGHGPWIPSPAVVVRGDARADTRVAEIRAVFGQVLADPSHDWIRDALLIDGFVPLDEPEYADLRTRWPQLA